MGPFDVPLFAFPVRAQNERAFFRANEYPYSAHGFYVLLVQLVFVNKCSSLGQAGAGEAARAGMWKSSTKRSSRAGLPVRRTLLLSIAWAALNSPVIRSLTAGPASMKRSALANGPSATETVPAPMRA